MVSGEAGRLLEPRANKFDDDKTFLSKANSTDDEYCKMLLKRGASPSEVTAKSAWQPFGTASSVPTRLQWQGNGCYSEAIHA